MEAIDTAKSLPDRRAPLLQQMIWGDDMHRRLILAFAMLATVNCFASAAWAGISCGGPLTSAQSEGFKAIFSPPFSPNLQHMGGPIAQGNFSKVVTRAQHTGFSVPTPKVAVQHQLSASNANVLKGWLNANSTATIPSWTASAIGIFVPQAWVGIAADVAIQLITSSGDAGRQSLANIAGTVSAGGRVAITERIARDGAGNDKYLWNYVYQAQLNGRELNFLLYSCSADVVVR